MAMRLISWGKSSAERQKPRTLKKLHLTAMKAGNPSRKTQGNNTSPQLVSPKPVESREQFARCAKGVT